MECKNSPKIQVTNVKEAAGRKDTRHTDGSELLQNLCGETQSPTRRRAMFSHSCGGADGYFCNESERADSIIHRRIGRALTLPRLARAGRPVWARSRGEEGQRRKVRRRRKRGRRGGAINTAIKAIGRREVGIKAAAGEEETRN